MKHRTWLGLLIVVSLCFSACDILPKPDGLGATPPDSPTATPVSQPDAPGRPTATPKPAEGTGGGTEPGDQAGDWGNLKSYRLYARQTDQQSGQVSETTTACVLDPFALQTITQGGDETIEMIAVSDTVWMRFEGKWYKTEFTPEEIADMENELDQELGELSASLPWPQDLVYLPGQVGLPLQEGSLTRAGAETVNGVSCIRYEVTSDYSHVMDMPMHGAVTATVQATGAIWVADQSGLPRMVMQADIYETETTTLPEGSTEIWTMHIEHQVTEINGPVSIEPPEGAVDMADWGSDMDDADDSQDDDTASTIDLDDLDSYRLEWTITVMQDEYETVSTYLFRWIKEPPTYYFQFDMGMEGIVFEHLWAGDRTWTRTPGSDWIEISSEEAPDPLDNLGGVMDWSKEMTPDGEETINGIYCKCYIDEFTGMPGIAGSHRICVADQAGIPPLVIYGVMRTEQAGMTTITESNLYDINQPITIETPD